MSKEQNGSERPAMFVVVEDLKLPAMFEKTCGRPMGEHVNLLKEMEMRPDDVLIAAFGKAGTHWIWEVAYMILSGKAEYEKRTKEFAMMEATDIQQLQSLRSPRIFNSHLPMHLLPKQIKEKKVKVIHVYRNCKDTLVSGYFHVRQMSGAEKFKIEDMERMSSSEGIGGNYFSYMKHMDEYKKKNPDVPCFTMSFEDTKEDPEKAVRKLAEFLGVEMSPQLAKDIAEATNITKMKEADKTKQQKADIPYVQMYRKGQVGDWKNHLTVAQSERLDADMKQLESCDYRFRYTL